MQYMDGVITAEEHIENDYMASWAESYRVMNVYGNDNFGDRVADKLYATYALTPIYVVQLDNGRSVSVLKANQCMQLAQVGDRIRIGSTTGNFEKGTREYYNLSRGSSPSMKPLKKYLNEKHEGVDGCEYQVSYEIKPGKKQGKYVWKKIDSCF